MKIGQRVKILSTDKANFAENISDEKKDSFKETWSGNWRILSIGESDNICVIVNEEGFYVSLPIGDIRAIKKVYLCGPITGMDNMNIEAFEKYEQFLLSKGFDVVNPQKLNHSQHEDKFEEFLKMDITELLKCDVLALMYNQPWEKSKGCRLEIFTAIQLNIPIIDAETLEEINISGEAYFSYKKKDSFSKGKKILWVTL